MFRLASHEVPQRCDEVNAVKHMVAKVRVCTCHSQCVFDICADYSSWLFFKKIEMQRTVTILL